jgi:hypothetical protein
MVNRYEVGGFILSGTQVGVLGVLGVGTEENQDDLEMTKMINHALEASFAQMDQEIKASIVMNVCWCECGYVCVCGSVCFVFVF